MQYRYSLKLVTLDGFFNLVNNVLDSNEQQIMIREIYPK